MTAEPTDAPTEEPAKEPPPEDPAIVAARDAALRESCALDPVVLRHTESCVKAAVSHAIHLVDSASAITDHRTWMWKVRTAGLRALADGAVPCLCRSRDRPQVTRVTRYVDRLGRRINVTQWADLCAEHGVGVSIAEQTVPHPQLGDLMVRTKWLGTVIPELDVQPWGTAVRVQPAGPWQELEQYDSEAAALAGHTRWVVAVVNAEPATAEPATAAEHHPAGDRAVISVELPDEAEPGNQPYEPG